MTLPNEEYLEQMRQVLDRMERRHGEAEQRMAGYEQMGHELESLEVSVVSPDRAVTVTAGAGGGVKSVELRQEAMRMTNQKLGRLITETIQRAAADAAKRQAAIVQELAGERLDVVGQVFKAQEQVFGTPEGTERPDTRVERSRPARAQTDDDDDEGFGSVFERRPR